MSRLSPAVARSPWHVPHLASATTLIAPDPYGAGWLYSVRGDPEGRSTGVEGYIAVLDATIETMLRNRHSEGEKEDA